MNNQRLKCHSDAGGMDGVSNGQRNQGRSKQELELIYERGIGR